MRVLVLNAGSGTLKWSLLAGRDQSTLESGDQERAHPSSEQSRFGRPFGRCLVSMPSDTAWSTAGRDS